MGAKYVIELEDETFEQNNDPKYPTGTNTLWRAKGFNSLVFDQNGLDKLEPYAPYSIGADQKTMDDEKEKEYRRGIEDAWTLAQKILSEDWHGRLQAAFPGMAGNESCIKCYGYDEALQKYLSMSEIKAGDIVENIQNGDRCIVLGVTKDKGYITYLSGDSGSGVVGVGPIGRYEYIKKSHLDELYWEMNER